MKKSLRILISGGGTGGHIFPAIAIADALRSKYPEAIVEFVGAKGRMEMEKIPAAGYKIHGLWISGLQRKVDLRNLLLPLKILSSLWKSYRIIKKFKPHITVGVGGYASGPLNFMASLMNIPLLLQEQNSYPGITNKLLKNRAAVICVAYPGMERYFPKEKIVLTGNPVRLELFNAKDSPEEACAYFGLNPGKPILLIIGGSLGARTINTAIENNLSSFGEEGIQLIWQTGKFYAGEQGRFDWGMKTPFIQRMDLAYKAADVVISRAGALSISELSAIGKAVILIPSPNVAEDHQTKNAMSLVSENAALLCRDQDAKSKLAGMVLDLLQNPEQIRKMEQNIKELGKRDATDRIVIELEKHIG